LQKTGDINPVFIHTNKEYSVGGGTDQEHGYAYSSGGFACGPVTTTGLCRATSAFSGENRGEPATSSKTRNETGTDTGPHSDGQRSAILPPPPNPDKPVGPPPTFEANLLESEREKLRAGPELQAEDPAKPETEKAAEPYAPPPQDTHQVDIAV